MCSLLQVSFAFSRIESALNYILNHLQELSGLAAEAERLDALMSGGRSNILHASFCEGVQLLYLPTASLMRAPNHFQSSIWMCSRCAAVKQITSEGPSIARGTSGKAELVLEHLSVTTPDGSRQLCQVGR